MGGVTDDPTTRERVLAAAAELLAERSIAATTRREVARAAGVGRRSVEDVAETRMDLLREVIAALPFPPVAATMALQAQHPTEPALQALLRAARDVLGDPGAAWDPLELQAISMAPYDDALLAVVASRLDRRWSAAEAVIHQLRGPGADHDEQVIEDAAAALHLIAVGLGLALLAPVAPRWSDARAWTGLTARMLESIADADPSIDAPVGVRWRARVTLPAQASATARMLRVLSLLRVRVVSLFTAPLDGDRQLVDLFLASAPDVDRATVAHGLSSVGSDVIVTSGRAEDAGDIATRVLDLSVRLVQHPEQTPQAAAELVLADSWEVVDAVEGADSTDFVLRLQWTPEQHVLLHRVRAPFTRTERHRASALLELVAAMSEAWGEADGFGWREILRGGEAVTVRLSRPADVTGVEELHDRCSEESRYERYFTPMNTWRGEWLRRISGGHRGATLVVTDEHDVVIALGNVFPLGPEESDSAEIAVLVEDAWHGRGVGAVLTERLIEVARRMEFGRLVAYVLASNRAMRGLLDASSLTWEVAPEHDLGPSVVCLAADL